MNYGDLKIRLAYCLHKVYKGTSMVFQEHFKEFDLCYWLYDTEQEALKLWP